MASVRVALGIVVVAACASTPAAKVLAMLGEPCSADADCGSMSCLHDACSRPCAVQGDCPTGFDCSLADAADPATTCHAPGYDTTQPGGFGTGCATVAGGCTTDPSPCAAGFHCVGAKCDPAAICSAACTTDLDCPPDLFCGMTGGEQVCLPRASCDPCLAGACAGGLACSPDGTCLRPCASDADCPHDTPPATPYLTCDPTTKLCTPRGACAGPSPVVSGQDVVCSPCRDGHPEDCGAGLTCGKNEFTGEQFCTEACTVMVTQDPNTGALSSSNDTCPPSSICTYGGPDIVVSDCGSTATNCLLQGACGADPAATRVTCYP